MKRFKKGFTLAEVLITLAIIGVVAAIAIPSVISNSQQQEFKTGLRKAVSVLNSAITMNMAIDGESPYDNKMIFQYLQKHMSIMKTTYALDWRSSNSAGSAAINTNAAFYTTDGMRFEVDDGGGDSEFIPLHESDVKACVITSWGGSRCGGCGSYGLATNPNGTDKPPCFILVDVNGDRKPTPGNINCKSNSCAAQNKYIVPVPESKKIGDIFLLLITEEKAIPYGVTAQKAMYDAQK